MMEPRYNRLKAFLVENNISQTSLAGEMGLDRSTLCNKLNGKGADFTISEVRYLVKRFDLDPKLFFLL